VARVLSFVLPPLAVLAILWFRFGGATWDAHLPLVFSGDALFYLAQTKSTMDHGWWWFNPSLGAPFGLTAATFAQNGNIDQAIVWVVSRFADSAIVVGSVSWMLMAALSAVTATWGFRRMGVTPAVAAAMSVLFALTPFALYRFIAHFTLVLYLLPIPATIAVLLASGEGTEPWPRRAWFAPLGGCILLGFNYVYFAFFGVFLISVGALVGAAVGRRAAPLRKGGLCVAAIVLATALNFVPNVVAWQAHGQPVGVKHVTAESEIFGLKIRHLIRPSGEHWFPPLQAWLDRDRAAGFLNETENTTGRLGLVGAIGFVGLVSVLLFPSAAAADGRANRVRAVALMALAAVLLATVGGFGSLFSLLVAADIRAYTRISPFIAFFAIAAVAFAIDRFGQTRPSAWKAAVLTAVLVLGVTDQAVAIGGRKIDVNGLRRDYSAVASVVGDLERALPAGAMVFQYPIRPFPVDAGADGIGIYEHFKPYLVSRQLRWSYPALNVDQRTWELGVLRLELVDVPRHLAREGFDAILLTRAALADKGDAFLKMARQPAAGVAVLVETERFIALDIRALRPGGAAGR
jgi:phosphoglycerol transferase